jgi:hypothetical protein
MNYEFGIMNYELRKPDAAALDGEFLSARSLYLPDLISRFTAFIIQNS